MASSIFRRIRLYNSSANLLRALGLHHAQDIRKQLACDQDVCKRPVDRNNQSTNNEILKTAYTSIMLQFLRKYSWAALQEYARSLP